MEIKCMHLNLDTLSSDDVKKLCELAIKHIPRYYYMWLYDENGNNPRKVRVEYGQSNMDNR